MTRVEKPLFRKHWAQPRLDEMIEKEPLECAEEQVRFHPSKSHLKERKPGRQARPTRRPPNIRELTTQRSRQDESLTQAWLRRFTFDGTVVPRSLSQFEFPAGEVPAQTTPPGPQRKRTEEDKRRVEAVLTTPVSLLAEYVSPEMMDMIQKSPYKAPNENVITFRSHRHGTRGRNLLECYKLLTRFIRNVASEIVYREKRIAEDEMMFREEGAVYDLRVVILSEAESKAMAWNLKKPFFLQVKQLRRKARKEASADASKLPQR